MSTEELQPLEPSRAFEMYLRERESEVSNHTIEAHRYRLQHFLGWCDERSIENLNELTGRDLHDYKLWRRDDGDLNRVTVKTQMDTLRVFIRFCERIDAVQAELADKVVSPSLGKGENERDVHIDAERAQKTLQYLKKFRYASFEHTLFLLLWHTGIRMGGARSLDLKDYNESKARITLRHRPEKDTPLKNKEEGERIVALTTDVCRVVDDWIEFQRPGSVDEFGRDPLFTTSHGRASRTTIRETIYRLTRPCEFTGDCPHGREMESCEATDDGKRLASQCPSSVSPHPIRRGSLTHHLSQDIPEKVVSDRADVSRDVLDAHYDERTEEGKVEQRRGYLSNL